MVKGEAVKHSLVVVIHNVFITVVKGEAVKHNLVVTIYNFWLEIEISYRSSQTWSLFQQWDWTTEYDNDPMRQPSYGTQRKDGGQKT